LLDSRVPGACLERRIGELMVAQRETVGLNNGGGRKTGVNGNPVSADQRPALAETGIDKKLADCARKMAAVPKLGGYSSFW
jgi:hypothetical protein